VEQVLRDVPRDQRCRCREQAPKDRDAAPADPRPSWLRALFGK
jgi:hypothetical protein